MQTIQQIVGPPGIQGYLDVSNVTQKLMSVVLSTVEEILRDTPKQLFEDVKRCIWCDSPKAHKERMALKGCPEILLIVTRLNERLLYSIDNTLCAAFQHRPFQIVSVRKITLLPPIGN